MLCLRLAHMVVESRREKKPQRVAFRGGIRTHDLLLSGELLYPLSYAPTTSVTG